MDMLSIICWLFLGFCGGIILTSLLATFKERLQERQDIRQRLYEQVQRKQTPCRDCVMEGRVCAFHTAELIEQLKAKVA